ncbi:MAG TPA: hypothetical protein VGL86_24700 [Polyangia bacterium]|jgi:hypothetical protein
MRKTPVVLGVLSIVFGMLSAACCMLAPLIVPMLAKLSEITGALPGQSDLQRAQMEAAQAALTAQATYMTVTSIVLGIMSISLVVIGVGLYRRRRWALRPTLWWALLGLALVVVNYVYALGWLQPHQRELQQAIYAAHGVAPAFQLSRTSEIVGSIFGVAMYSAYPIVLIALLGRRSAVNDFRP